MVESDSPAFYYHHRGMPYQRQDCFFQSQFSGTLGQPEFAFAQAQSIRDDKQHRPRQYSRDSGTMGSTNFREARRRLPWIVMRSHRAVLHHSRSRSRSLSRNSSTYRMGMRKSDPAGDYDTVDGFGATTAAMANALRQQAEAKRVEGDPVLKIQKIFITFMLGKQKHAQRLRQALDSLRGLPFSENDISRLQKIMKATTTAQSRKCHGEVHASSNVSSKIPLETEAGISIHLMHRKQLARATYGFDAVIKIRKVTEANSASLSLVDEYHQEEGFLRPITTIATVVQQYSNGTERVWEETYERVWECCACEREVGTVYTAGNICSRCHHLICESCTTSRASEPVSGLKTIEEEMEESDEYEASDEASDRSGREPKDTLIVPKYEDGWLPSYWLYKDGRPAKHIYVQSLPKRRH